MLKHKLSFPHMGDYHMPISRLLRDLFPEAEILTAPPITTKTIDLGARHSPDFVCSPFKYNMGNYIEALEAGATVLLQTGMGCRYGYYGEVQRQILQDMGYEFIFLCFSRERARLRAAFSACRQIRPKLSYAAFLKAVEMAVLRIGMMDRLDYILRERIGFELSPGAFEAAKREFLDALAQGDSVSALYSAYRCYRRVYKGIELCLPSHPLRVGIVGELYTLMEPFSNHSLEKQLARAGALVSRRMSVSFLLFGKRDRLSLRKSGAYLEYTVGANGVDSVSQCLGYAKRGYDGVLHIKSFGCTPELNAQPALMNISRDKDIPILHLSFDAQTSETGLQTRLEAFIDMIGMKREGAHV